MKSAEIIRQEASLDDVMRYFAGGYQIDGELLDVKYAITEGHPRRVWFQLTVRAADTPEGSEG